MHNPLLDSHFSMELPAFDQIRAEHFEPAIKQLTQRAQADIESIVEGATECSWQSVFYPIEEALDQLEQAWSVVGHLNAVTNTEPVRNAYTACLPHMTNFSTWLGQYERLYEVTENFSEGKGFGGLSVSRKKVIANSLRDFRLSGIGLGASDKDKYAAIQKQLSELTTRFANNVLDATQSFTLNIDSADKLKGLPDLALESARELAASKNMEGYLLTLDLPSYLPAMQYCENRQIRETLYHAYNTRASECGPDEGKFDNSELMQEILKLRKELSLLLGFESYAEYSLATKMAGSSTEVIGFLEGLADHSVNAAREEYANLRAFAARDLDLPDMQAWDIPFVSEKLRKAEYDLSQEELRPYFPADKVIDGMFAIVQRLFGCRIRPHDAPALWDDDIRFYCISDAGGEPLAYFYLDLFAREGKRGGAWMADCKSRRVRSDGSQQLPVAFLVCNFSAPTNDTPSLLTHNEVITLFHEFGHGLHHMLTVENDAAVAGINGVAWDAVELPSQFMENWCWQSEALALVSSHYQSDASLPDTLLDKMLAAKNFQSAMQMVRQLEFGLFDMLVHGETGQPSSGGIRETLASVRNKVAAYPVPDYNRFANSFSHIFAGGYAAGYYSYKWAEVLSADAFSLFEERGIFDEDTGKQFYRHILSRGGSEDAAVLFENFRGRKPGIDALLRHSGIVGND